MIRAAAAFRSCTKPRPHTWDDARLRMACAVNTLSALFLNLSQRCRDRILSERPGVPLMNSPVNQGETRRYFQSYTCRVIADRDRQTRPGDRHEPMYHADVRASRNLSFQASGEDQDNW